MHFETETTKTITTGQYLVTDPKSEFHGQTLKVQSGVYGHLGEQIGVLLETEDIGIGWYTTSFFWAQIVRAEPLTDAQKEAYYYEQEMQQQNYSPAHWGL